MKRLFDIGSFLIALAICLFMGVVVTAWLTGCLPADDDDDAAPVKYDQFRFCRAAVLWINDNCDFNNWTPDMVNSCDEYPDFVKALSLCDQQRAIDLTCEEWYSCIFGDY